VTTTRTLGPELTAEGWTVIGNSMWWIHWPSNRSVVLDEDMERRNCHVPTWGPEPTSPETVGYFVGCSTHDEHGNPIFGDGFWVESYATALRLARRIRESILAEGPAAARNRKSEYERRKGEWLTNLFGGRRP